MKKRIVAALLISALLVEGVAPVGASSALPETEASVVEETTEEESAAPVSEPVVSAEMEETEEAPKLTLREDEDAKAAINENNLVLTFTDFSEGEAYKVELTEKEEEDPFFTWEGEAEVEEALAEITFELPKELPEVYLATVIYGEEAYTWKLPEELEEGEAAPAEAAAEDAEAADNQTVDNAEAVEGSAEAAAVAAEDEENVTVQDINTPDGKDTLAPVTGLTATPGEMSATLNWTAVASAASYVIYSIDTNTSVATVLQEDVTACTWTKTGLTNGTQYIYGVRACSGLTTDGTTLFYSSGVPVQVKVTPACPGVNAPSGLSITTKSGSNTLKWNAAAGVAGYNVYYLQNGTYVRVGQTTGRSFVHRTTTYGNMKYAVKAYDAAGHESAGIEKIVFGADTKAVINSQVHPIWYTVTAKKNTPCYNKSKGGKKVCTVPAKTKMTVIQRGGANPEARVKVVIPGRDGYVFIQQKKMKYNKQLYTTADYTTEQKEYYVNSNNFTSKTNYFIWISTYTQRVNIFQKVGGQWKLIRVFRCASGKMATPTYLGTRKIKKRYKAYGHGNIEYYWSIFMGEEQAFHSLQYRRKTHKIVNKTLGKPLSHGCIRLNIEDAHFIYDLPMKTAVRAW